MTSLLFFKGTNKFPFLLFVCFCVSPGYSESANCHAYAIIFQLFKELLCALEKKTAASL